MCDIAAEPERLCVHRPVGVALLAVLLALLACQLLCLVSWLQRRLGRAPARPGSAGSTTLSEASRPSFYGTARWHEPR